MSISHTAWATTKQSMPGADPGIGITATRTSDLREDHAYREELGIVQDSVTDWDDWDADAADDELARMGWPRTGDWTNSGGQMAATVKPAK